MTFEAFASKVTITAFVAGKQKHLDRGAFIEVIKKDARYRGIFFGDMAEEPVIDAIESIITNSGVVMTCEMAILTAMKVYNAWVGCQIAEVKAVSPSEPDINPHTPPVATVIDRVEGANSW